MAIQGFDYKEFAKNLASQATELVPKDLMQTKGLISQVPC